MANKKFIVASILHLKKKKNFQVYEHQNNAPKKTTKNSSKINFNVPQCTHNIQWHTQGGAQGPRTPPSEKSSTVGLLARAGYGGWTRGAMAYPTFIQIADFYLNLFLFPCIHFTLAHIVGLGLICNFTQYMISRGRPCLTSVRV